MDNVFAKIEEVIINVVKIYCGNDDKI